jgi:hypothetical protein
MRFRLNSKDEERDQFTIVNRIYLVNPADGLIQCSATLVIKEKYYKHEMAVPQVDMVAAEKYVSEYPWAIIAKSIEDIEESTKVISRSKRSKLREIGIELETTG